MSHSITDAWNEFVRDNPRTMDATGLGCDKKQDYYLANRLDRAFKAGVQAGEQIAKQRTLEKLNALLS